MRSLLALIVCTGLIAWAHAAKHKYFGLRADQPAILAVTPVDAAGKDLVKADDPTPANARRKILNGGYLRSLEVLRPDSLSHRHLLAHELSNIWLQQMQ